MARLACIRKRKSSNDLTSKFYASTSISDEILGLKIALAKIRKKRISQMNLRSTVPPLICMNIRHSKLRKY